jgi:hypothetical protein
MRSIVASLLVFYSVSHAQVTINDADFGAANDTIRYSEVLTDSWGLNVANTGTAITWDFSMMIPDYQKIDTLYSVSSTGTLNQIIYNNPFSQSYKAAWARKEIAIDLGALIPLENILGFYKIKPDAFNYVGASAEVFGFAIPAQADTIETVYPLPLLHGDNYNQIRYVKAEIPGVLYFDQYKVVESFTEGEGTLITPFGTFQALKVRKEIDEIDSIYLDTLGFGFSIPQPHVTEYHWLVAGLKMPVMIYTDRGALGSSITYQDSIRDVPTLNIPEKIALKANLYPNPVTDILYMDFTVKPDYYEVYSVTGSFIYRENPKLARVQMNTTDLAEGMYIVHAVSGTTRFIRKFIVER